MVMGTHLLLACPTRKKIRRLRKISQQNYKTFLGHSIELRESGVHSQINRVADHSNLMRLFFILLLISVRAISQQPLGSSSQRIKPSEASGDNQKAAQPRPSTNQPSTQTNAEQRDKKTVGSSQPRTIDNLANWLVALFTGALAILATLQWLAMNRQAAYMRKGLHISIRQARTASRNALAAKLNAEA